MAATTQIVPGVEISAPDDDMDLHTDDGFDFGDGDIELDLDPAPSVHDDDLSIQDAVSDGGLDLETAQTDQDDFMADHGDLIEEDIYDDDAGSVVMQALADDDAATEAPMLEAPDEDLIDYSDDEGQQPQKIQSNMPHHEDVEIHDGEVDDLSFLSNAPLDDTQDPGFANHSQDEPQDNQEQTLDDHTLDDLEATAHASGADTQSVGKPESPSHDGGHHTDGEDGGVQLPAEESITDVAENDHSLSKDDAQSTYDDTQEEHEDNQSSELHPITVNYAGSEFWLFKQHDLEDSGDWLLEDSSLVKSSMSDFFQACRSSLGDDVSNEQELGLCFDHLNSLEIYEDNSACVAVTLERLVDLYYMLQAQDNNTEPEPFYVMLQFRPRFATLLSDVAKFADEGRGYSALTSAITAGETHFTNSFAFPGEHDDYVSSDYDATWNDENNGETHDAGDEEHEGHSGEVQENEKNVEVREDKDHDGETQEGGEHATEEETGIDPSIGEIQRHTDNRETENDPSEVVHEAVHEELHEELHEEVHEEGQEVEAHQFEQEPEVQEQPVETTAIEQPLEGEHDINKHENTDLERAAETDFHQGAVEESTEHHDAIDESRTRASPPFDERTPDQILHDKQTEADIVDYSDDEDQEDDETGAVAFNKMSPSSTTVQGDEPLRVEETGHQSGSQHVTDEDEGTYDVHHQHDEVQDIHGQNEIEEIHDHNGEVQEELDFDVEHENGATSGFEHHVDDGEDTYHDGAQEYEQDGSFQDFEADTAEGGSLERAFEGDITHGSNEFEHQALEDEANVDINGEYEGDNGADSVAAGEEIADADGFLDLDNAPEWVTDKEPAFELPEDVVLVHDDGATHDEEDDLGDLSAVATSPAADPTATSSAELTVLSPQGRKRSIDEVGNGTEEATESTDAKRPRV